VSFRLLPNSVTLNDLERGNRPNGCVVSPNSVAFRFGAMLKSYHKLQQKRKSVPEFKDALQLIWSALPDKSIDNTAKDYCKRLQACVLANGGHFEHMMRKFIKQVLSVIFS